MNCIDSSTTTKPLELKNQEEVQTRINRTLFHSHKINGIKKPRSTKLHEVQRLCQYYISIGIEKSRRSTKLIKMPQFGAPYKEVMALKG